MKLDINTNYLQFYSYDNLRVMKLELIMVTLILYRKYHYSVGKIAKLLKLSTKVINNVVNNTNIVTKYKHDNYFRHEVKANVNWFVKHQRPVYVNHLSTNYIIGLLSMPITTSKIAKVCHVAQPIISYLRNRKRKISSLSLKTVNKLITGYKRIKPWATPIGIASELCPKLFVNTIFCAPRELLMKMFKYNPNVTPTTYNLEHHNKHDIYLLGIKPNDNEFKCLICISYAKPNIIYNYTPKQSPRYFVNACKKLASVPTNLRHWNDAQYMQINWMLDKIKVLNYSYSLNTKEICKRMHCNPYLVHLVMDTCLD